MQGFDYFINIIESLLMAYLNISFLKLKMGNKYTHLILLSTILFIEICILNSIFHYEAIFLLVYIITIFLYDYFVSKNHYYEILMISTLTQTTVAVCNAFALFLVSIILSMDIQDLLNNIIYFRGAIVLSKVIYAIAVYLLAKVFRKMSMIWDNYFRCFLVIIICAHFCFSFYEKIIFSNQTNKLSAFISMVLLSVIVIVSIYQFYKLALDNMKKINDMILYQEIESLQKQFSSIEEQNIKMRIFRHDIQNVLILIRSYAEKADLDYIKEVIHNKEKELEEIKPISITGIMPIDIILNSKIEEISTKEITFNRKVIMSSLHNIDHLEFCLLLTNAINNAIENIGGERTISLAILETPHYIEIDIRNSVDQNVFDINPQLKSSKKDKTKHGFGIESMRRIVDKYSGIFFIDCDDKEFFLLMQLKYNTNKTDELI